jgi:glycosyltransferase involved in cell wall biosynthesis
MRFGCSVVICTRNPRVNYLSRVLTALKEQTLPMTEWELLLIDNGSENPLEEFVDLSWHPASRYVAEPEPGLTPARLRALAEVRGELITFVDDDNILDPSYLSECMLIAQQFPCLGAWGGQLFPEFEVPPAPELENLLEGLALRQFHRPRWSNYDSSTCPYGAGLCVRASVGQRYASIVNSDQIRRSLDRRGNSLMGGGDLDLAMTSYQLGMGTGLFPQLKLLHLIPKHRVERDYLYEICVAGTYAGHLVNFFHLGPPAQARHSLATLRRLIRRVKLLLPRRWITLYEQASLEGTQRAEEDIMRLRSQAPYRINSPPDPSTFASNVDASSSGFNLRPF